MTTTDYGAETWLPVAGFEGFYEVSNAGRVRSLHRGGRKILATALNTSGYPRVILRVAGTSTTRTVHRLVALAFHADKQNALHREVDHIDRDRTNARAGNLRWVSKGENMARRIRTPTNTKLTYALADEIRAERGRRKAKVVAADYGIRRHTVYDIWLGRSFATREPSPSGLGPSGECHG